MKNSSKYLKSRLFYQKNYSVKKNCLYKQLWYVIVLKQMQHDIDLLMLFLKSFRPDWYDPCQDCPLCTAHCHPQGQPEIIIFFCMSSVKWIKHIKTAKLETDLCFWHF